MQEEEDVECVGENVGDSNAENVITQKNTMKRNGEDKTSEEVFNETFGNEYVYPVARFIEMISIAVFIFGLFWEIAEVLNLSTPEFMMLYGGIGALACEGISRLFTRKKKRKIMSVNT